MESIKASIQTVLPNLTEDLVISVAQCVVDSGVEELDDLQYVEEADLKALLKTIQARKLIQAWRKADPAPAPGEADSDHADPPALQQLAPPQTPPARPVAPQSGPFVNIDANWPETMSLPWADMPADVKTAMRNAKRLAPAPRKKVVRIIVDAMLTHHPNPNKKQAAAVAKRVVRHAPESLEDRSGLNERMGTGYGSLATQLRNRVEFKTRENPLVRLRKPRRTVDDSDTPSPAAPVDAYGCINWQPPFPDGETEEGLEAAQAELKDLYSQGQTITDVTSKVIDKAMMKTYFLQRKFINGKPPPSIADIRAEWPFLFWRRWLFVHFKFLTGIAVSTKITESFAKKGGTIKRYFQSLDPVGNRNKAVHQIIREAEEAAKEVEDTDDLDVAGLLMMVMAYFGEDADSMLLLADVTDSPRDVEEKLHLPDTPRLIVQGHSILTGSKWMLSMEGKVVGKLKTNGTASFATAVGTLMASYYVFNLRYEERAEITLELLQRCFLGIEPDTGTKCVTGKTKRNGKVIQRKRVPVNPHVHTFMRDVAYFGWV